MRSIWLVAIYWCALFAFLVTPVLAETVDDYGLWTALFASGDINPHAKDGKWRWWFDGQMRFFDDFDGYGQADAMVRLRLDTY
jgi:hypothetical protein